MHRWQLPGLDTAVVYAWRKDNSGPANASEVIVDFAAVRLWFPGAQVRAELQNHEQIAVWTPSLTKTLCARFTT